MLSFERTTHGRFVRGPSIQRFAGSTWTATHNQAASAGYRSQIPWAHCFLYSWGDPLGLFVKANVCDISPPLISFASSLWVNDNLPASPLRPIPDRPYCHPRHIVAVMLAATRGAGQPPQPPFADPPTRLAVGSNEGDRATPATATRRTAQPPHPVGDEGGRATPATATRQPTHQTDR